MRADDWHVVEIWNCELEKDRIAETRERLHQEISYAFIICRKGTVPFLQELRRKELPSGSHVLMHAAYR